MSCIKKISSLLLLVGVVITLTVSCSNPNPEELYMVDDQLNLAVLPFKKDNKYIAIQLINTKESAPLIEQIKRIDSLFKFEIVFNDYDYYLIDSIEHFDRKYRSGMINYILVKKLKDGNGHFKFIFIDYFDVNNF